ncbi:MAG: redoxin domain-containing protein [bacterium]|nr:redoxin domain-containing protein [bacterium]
MAEYDVEVLYVSLDSVEKNAEFAASLKARIPVLSDPRGETAKRYGVLGFGGLYSKRWTFYIDESGILREIDKNVNPERAGQDIVAKLARLGFAKRSSSESMSGAARTRHETRERGR